MKPESSILALTILNKGLGRHYIVDFKRNDVSLNLKNDSEWSQIYTGDCYAINIKDNETYLNNFATSYVSYSRHDINNNYVIGYLAINFHVFVMNIKIV